MSKNRMEAFSDGVLAVAITIMVLELKSPHGTTPAALRPLIPVLLSYVLSFVYIGIYWNNHHHLLHATQRVNGAALWANLHLLFWLSLIPFPTAWMGDNFHHSWPPAVYVNCPASAPTLHLLFWLAVIPFTTAWMGDNFHQSWPVAVYGIVLLLAVVTS